MAVQIRALKSIINDYTMKPCCAVGRCSRTPPPRSASLPTRLAWAPGLSPRLPPPLPDSAPSPAVPEARWDPASWLSPPPRSRMVPGGRRLPVPVLTPAPYPWRGGQPWPAGWRSVMPREASTRGFHRSCFLSHEGWGQGWPLKELLEIWFYIWLSMAVKENCSGQSLRNTTFLSQTKHVFWKRGGNFSYYFNSFKILRNIREKPAPKAIA